jgi:tetratricopeptide (TPR) repeat protein
VKLLRSLVASGILVLPLVTSCGREPPAEEVPAAGEEAPLSEVPEAQAAYDESVDLWGTDNPASIAKAYEATALDPNFVEAYGLLSNRYAWIHQNWDRSDSIANQALAHARKALEMDPESISALSAMGAYHYRIEKDFASALEYYTRGAEIHPEATLFIRMQAHVARRMGDWDGALEFLTRAEGIESTLDGLQAIAENHEANRRWDQATDYFGRHAERNPESTLGPSNMAWMAFNKNGDTGPLRAFLAAQPTGWSAARWNLEMLDRDFEAALAAVDASSTEVYNSAGALTPRATLRGIALRQLGREAEAITAFEEAKATMEAMLPELDHDCRVHEALGDIMALLGMRDEAIREGQRAVELMPPEKDAILGPNNVAGLARIYAVLGEAELAAEQIRYLLDIPTDSMNRQWLLKGSAWDGIREHPAFQALLIG